MATDPELDKAAVDQWAQWARRHDGPPVTEEYPTVAGLPLRLSLTPAAIRDHYGDMSETVNAMSDRDLADVGHAVLCSDAFYRAFHAALTEAFVTTFQFDPDDECADETDAEEEDEDEDGD